MSPDAATPVANGDLPPEILQALEEPYSLQADLQFEADLFGKRWTGRGVYRELRSGPIPQSRLEVFSGLAGTEKRLLQVCDGTKLWIHDEIENADRVLMLDARRCQEVQNAGDAKRPVAALGFGGIAGLLRRLQRTFFFGPPQNVDFQGRACRRIVGVLRRRGAERLLQGNGGDNEGTPQPDDATTPDDWRQLPPRIPTHVVLLFFGDVCVPARVDYYRLPPESPGSTALLFLKTSGVRINHATNAQDFIFTPPQGVKVLDQTDEFAARLP